jgi:hypothetical protein
LQIKPETNKINTIQLHRNEKYLSDACRIRTGASSAIRATEHDTSSIVATASTPDTSRHSQTPGDERKRQSMQKRENATFDFNAAILVIVNKFLSSSGSEFKCDLKAETTSLSLRSILVPN